MSQTKSAEVVTTVLAQLEGDDPYADSSLAREMRLAPPDPSLDAGSRPRLPRGSGTPTVVGRARGG